MKINWGTGIAIFYTLFVIAMVTMVIRSTYHKSHLVQENYYEMDINYEDFRQKRQNGNRVKDLIVMQYLEEKKSIELTFPENYIGANGRVTLFRPSNKHLDKSFTLALNESGIMNIPIDKTYTSGLWKIQMTWELEGTEYFNEKDIII